MAMKKRKVKNRIRVKQRARLVHKNDKTRVARRDTIDLVKYSETPMPRSNGAVFKVKVKRK